MSGHKLPAIERPNGKLYRPRKIQAIGLGNEDDVFPEDPEKGRAGVRFPVDEIEVFQ